MVMNLNIVWQYNSTQGVEYWVYPIGEDLSNASILILRNKKIERDYSCIQLAIL